MKAILTDLLAIIGVVLNGLPQGLLALTFGFASVPTALAFFVGAVGNTITQSVAPISFQAETITYAGTAGKDRSERCTMIFIGGVIMALIGVFGLLTKIVNFVGEDVAYGMMAGVGIILVKAAIDMIKSDHLLLYQSQCQYPGLYHRHFRCSILHCQCIFQQREIQHCRRG